MLRRDWLRLTSSSGLAFLGEILRQRHALAKSPAASQLPGFGRAKSVIVVFVSGGQSQLETWDPKPDAPSEVRGAFGATSTSVPGTLLCDRLPRLASLAHRYSIVRTMSHKDLDHGSAFYLAMTGRYHQRLSSNPPVRPIDHPFFGSVLKRVRPTDRFVHTSVLVNGPAQVPFEIGPGQFGGFMGKDFDPMIVGDVTTGRPPVPGLTPIAGLEDRRRSSRVALLSSLETAQASSGDYSPPMFDMQALYRQAFEMLDRPEAREAFNIEAEPASLRDRYGRHRPGQACLLGRRLVEAGVPLVTVMWNHSNRGQDRYPDDDEEHGWDTHNDIFQVMDKSLLPKFDQSFSAMLEDLDQRGMLEDTLVVCMGEFGRAPLVALEPRFAGATPGRKHWAATYSIVFAGAGVTPGSVIGKSDRHAGYPATERFAPWDVTATIFHALGIDPSGHFLDLTERPYTISDGRPITQVYG